MTHSARNISGRFWLDWEWLELALMWSDANIRLAYWQVMGGEADTFAGDPT